MSDKPPLGLVPKSIWLRKRHDAILDAMQRYRDNQYIIPVEWTKELIEISKELKGKQ